MGLLLALPRPVPAGPLPLADQIPHGRLVELCGDHRAARLSLAVTLVRKSQHEGESVAWVQPRGGGLYPPDLHDGGVDLASLLVIHIPPAGGTTGLAKAAEILLRSGALGLVVLDLTASSVPRGEAWLNRLAALAREHKSRVLLLTSSSVEAPSLGALVSLRLLPARERLTPGHFVVTPTLLKDKLGLVGPPEVEHYRGPWGLL